VIKPNHAMNHMGAGYPAICLA